MVAGVVWTLSREGGAVHLLLLPDPNPGKPVGAVGNTVTPGIYEK